MVIGGSVAGLLAACVLTEAVDEVILVERDAWSDAPVHRRGVPQGRQPHLLLGRGREVLDRLCPGFSEDVVAAGGHEWDFQGDGRYFSEAGLMAHRPVNLMARPESLLSPTIAGRVLRAQRGAPTSALER